jgi:pimeloyl-ACP methyl ester carboxylesterase
MLPRKVSASIPAVHVLLVPGLNCTAALFAPQMDVLGAQHQLHVADHGRFDTMEQDAAAILAEAPDRFALCGLSMGGYLAFEILRQAPGRVARLALIDTRCTGDAPEEAARRRQMLDLVRTGRFASLHNILWPRLVHPARREDAQLEATVRAMMEDTGPDRFSRQQTAILHRPDYRPVLHTITVPTLLLVGDHDVLTPPAASKEMAATISGSELVIVPECGHLSTLEQPQIVARHLDRWLG